MRPSQAGVHPTNILQNYIKNVSTAKVLKICLKNLSASNAFYKTNEFLAYTGQTTGRAWFEVGEFAKDDRCTNVTLYVRMGFRCKRYCQNFSFFAYWRLP